MKYNICTRICPYFLNTHFFFNNFFYLHPPRDGSNSHKLTGLPILIPDLSKAYFDALMGCSKPHSISSWAAEKPILMPYGPLKSLFKCSSGPLKSTLRCHMGWIKAHSLPSWTVLTLITVRAALLSALSWASPKPIYIDRLLNAYILLWPVCKPIWCSYVNCSSFYLLLKWIAATNV